MKISVLFVLLVAAIFFPHQILAQEDNQFVTIVNPVRVSKYTESPEDSLRAEYDVILEYKLPATWLLTYDALASDEIYRVVKDFDDTQELGIFLEVGPKLAGDAGVFYSTSGYWYHANVVFLVGYLQEERIKLIDTVFNKFKERFGYFPLSVGSWWTDAYSLEYMSQKYGIVANLGVSDQFSTDGYQVWGQPWSTPFYPNRLHAGMPASDINNKLNIVTIQWAPRDPLNGYFSSLYSTQDYLIAEDSLSVNYFEKLVNLYSQAHSNQIGQITVGLEADLSFASYQNEFKNQMLVIKNLVDSGKLSASSIGEFGKWYQGKFKDLSPVSVISSKDLLGKTKRVFWYQSPQLRVGILYDEESKLTEVFDFRVYFDNFQEPYYLFPNREFNLFINVPSLIDKMQDGDSWHLNLGALLDNRHDRESFSLVYETGKIEVLPDKFLLKGSAIDIPEKMRQTSLLMIKSDDKGVVLQPSLNFSVDEKGYLFQDLSLESSHLLRNKKLVIFLVFVFSVIAFAILKFIRHGLMKDVLVFFLLTAVFIFFINWRARNLITYFVSQSEIDALTKLSTLPEGRILVYDKECLQCSYQSGSIPAVFANKRRYVEEISGHKILANQQIFRTEDREQARHEFAKLDAKYLYLVKYGDYVEKIPFSPGDLGIEKIYTNANAEIWKKKE